MVSKEALSSRRRFFESDLCPWMEILRLLLVLEKSPRMTTVTRAQTDNLEKLQPGTGHTKPGKWKTRESRGFSNKQRSFDNEPEVSKRRKEAGHE